MTRISNRNIRRASLDDRNPDDRKEDRVIVEAAVGAIVEARDGALSDAVVESSRAGFWLVGAAILVVGALLRLWRLGDAPFSHDEAIHAHFSLHFADYSYDPTYHGPLLYHLTAACFRVLGDSDWSARLVPALLGIALLWLALGTRRWLGGGALWACALLAISPCIAAYSRRLLHDALVLLLTLGAVVCFQIARETISRSLTGRAARIALVVLCALLLATKANAWFVIAMLLGFYLVQAARNTIPFDLQEPSASDSRRTRAKRSEDNPDETARARPQNTVGAAKVDVAEAAVAEAAVAEAAVAHGTGAVLPIVGRDGAWQSRSWECWLPCGALFVIALASSRVFYTPLAPLANTVPPDISIWTIGESSFTFLCAASVLLMMEWLRRAPYPSDSTLREVAANEGKSSATVFPVQRSARDVTSATATSATATSATATSAAATRGAKRDDDFAAPSGWDWVSPLIAFVLGFCVLAWLYGHGVTWWRAPGQIGPRLWSEVLGPGSALPRMLEYWGGQQKAPRLPGPHDYYIVLMLLYELPIAIAAVAGVWRASRERAPFTDLLLWWAFTSFALYSLANEKVPWLLVHIMLPLSLLAGNWLWHMARDLWPHMSTHVAAQQQLGAAQASSAGSPTASSRKTQATSPSIAHQAAAHQAAAHQAAAHQATGATSLSSKNVLKRDVGARELAKSSLARELEASRVARRRAWRRGAFVAGCALGALFLARGLMATSFERSGDNHEPLFYANSTEAFHDALLWSLRRTRGQSGVLWVGQEKEWPNVWYLRPGAPFVDNSVALFSIAPPLSSADVSRPNDSRPNALRVAQSPTEDEWKTVLAARQISLPEWQALQRQLNGRRSETVDFIIWPRAHWSALRPDRFARFWWFRQANDSNGILGEWSHNKVVISTPPDVERVE